MPTCVVTELTSTPRSDLIAQVSAVIEYQVNVIVCKSRTTARYCSTWIMLPTGSESRGGLTQQGDLAKGKGQAEKLSQHCLRGPPTREIRSRIAKQLLCIYRRPANLPANSTAVHSKQHRRYAPAVEGSAHMQISDSACRLHFHMGVLVVQCTTPRSLHHSLCFAVPRKTLTLTTLNIVSS